jgi:hypothetical protein
LQDSFLIFPVSSERPAPGLSFLLQKVHLPGGLAYFRQDKSKRRIFRQKTCTTVIMFHHNNRTRCRARRRTRIIGPFLLFGKEDNANDFTIASFFVADFEQPGRVMRPG